MNWSLLNVTTNFNNLRYSAGIAMMFNGFPLIFFFRDTLGIGPASSVFTAAFFTLALLLMTPVHLFKRLYKPNVILLNLGLGFLFLTFYYFIFINSVGKSVADIGNYVFVFGFIVLLLHVPNDVKDTLVIVFFLFRSLPILRWCILCSQTRTGLRVCGPLSALRTMVLNLEVILT